MRYKVLAFVLLTSALFSVRLAEAQQPETIPKIGVLEPGPAKAPSVCTDGFRQSLRDLGYIETKNILLENRYGEFKLDRLREAGLRDKILPDTVSQSTVSTSWPT